MKQKFRKCFPILGPRPISGKIFQLNLTMMLFDQFDRARSPVGRRALLETKITKTFRKNCSLTNHVQTIYDNVKEFHCEKCMKQFGRKSTLANQNWSRSELITLNPLKLMVFSTEFSISCSFISIISLQYNWRWNVLSIISNNVHLIIMLSQYLLLLVQCTMWNARTQILHCFAHRQIYTKRTKKPLICQKMGGCAK